MADDLKAVDPVWAWSPFQSGEKQPWNRALAGHLYRRAGFGASREQLDEAVRDGLAATLDRLLSTDDSTAEFDRRVDRLAEAILATNNPQRLSAWWLYRMLGTPAQGLEKLTLFWHGHFATSAAKVEDADMILAQYRLLRQHALGRFEPLVQALSRDPAMLIWLDSTTNHKKHPNENYGRELLELFCLGVGNYSEKDIQEVARAFTGWEVRRDKFEFNQFQHDPGKKTIFGQTGSYNGEDAVRLVLAQPAAPRFIARKLIRFFVCDEPEIPSGLIDGLAHSLRESNFEIGPVVRTILSSNLFFSAHAIGRKIRSPVELGVGLLRSLEATTNVFGLATGLQELGQAVFFPPNVKGWDGGRTWINSSTLLSRANLVRQLMTANETRFGGGRGLAEMAIKAGAVGPEEAIEWLAELLLAVPLSASAREPLLKLAREGTLDQGRISQLVHAISALPEFQLG